MSGSIALYSHIVWMENVCPYWTRSQKISSFIVSLTAYNNCNNCIYTIFWPILLFSKDQLTIDVYWLGYWAVIFHQQVMFVLDNRTYQLTHPNETFWEEHFQQQWLRLIWALSHGSKKALGFSISPNQAHRSPFLWRIKKTLAIVWRVFQWNISFKKTFSLVIRHIIDYSKLSWFPLT